MLPEQETPFVLLSHTRQTMKETQVSTLWPKHKANSVKLCRIIIIAMHQRGVCAFHCRHPAIIVTVMGFTCMGTVTGKRSLVIAALLE